MAQGIDLVGGEAASAGTRAMRVLTTMLAAACFAAACRGRETAEPAEAIATPEESAIEAVQAQGAPTVEYVQSVTTVERSSIESSTSSELTLPAEPRTTPDTPTPAPSSCCRTCRSGRACGNTCIAANRECHTPPGCACDE